MDKRHFGTILTRMGHVGLRFHKGNYEALLRFKWCKGSEFAPDMRRLAQLHGVKVRSTGIDDTGREWHAASYGQGKMRELLPGITQYMAPGRRQDRMHLIQQYLTTLSEQGVRITEETRAKREAIYEALKKL